MDRKYKNLQLDYPAIVQANPGTQREVIYLIRVVDISPSEMWFRSNASLSYGTPTKVTVQLKYGPEQRTVKVKFSGRVIRTEPEGFTVLLENS